MFRILEILHFYLYCRLEQNTYLPIICKILYFLKISTESLFKILKFSFYNVRIIKVVAEAQPVLVMKEEGLLFY